MALLALVAVASCGLSDDSGFIPFDPADDRFGLSQTTSSTSTVPPTTPDSVVSATTTTIVEQTTTTIATELVDVFFVSGSRLTAVATPLPAEPSLGQVLAALVEGPPPGALGAGLRSALPLGVEVLAEQAGGRATVDLPSEYFDEVPITDQRFVFAQLVLTLTDRPGIGQIVFLSAGEPMRVYRGDASLTDPGEPVSRDDYARLLTGAPPEPTDVPEPTEEPAPASATGTVASVDG